MVTYDATLQRALSRLRDDAADAVAEERSEAQVPTAAQSIARASLTLAIMIGMSALFATQVYATLH